MTRFQHSGTRAQGVSAVPARTGVGRAGSIAAEGRTRRGRLRLPALGALILVSSTLGLGCASNTRATGAGARSVDAAGQGAAPDPVVLPRVVVSPTRAESITQIMSRADAAFDAKNYASAAEGYFEVFVLEPDGALAERALFGAGTASDLAGQNEQALRRYEALVGRFPGSASARTAHVRSVRLYAFFEQWQQAGRAADVLLVNAAELGPFEIVLLYGAKALSLVALGNDTEASYYVGKARNIIEERRLDAAGEIPRDLTLAYYALGEIHRLRAERIKFVPVPPDFARVLEERCQLILDAQSSYSDTMRAHDAHWSAMAGYRVGELYQRLHQDLMAVPAPRTADSDARQRLFEGAMRLRYSILLDKARSMMEHTLRMTERTEERSGWVGKVEQALVQLEAASERERAALAALPYSRLELQQALDDLERKGHKAGSP